MILVTGAAGFIGSHLCESLKDREIIIIDNFNDFYDPSIKRNNIKDLMQNTKAKKITLEEGDIRDFTFLQTVFNKYPIQTVVHLAAMAGVRPSLKNPLLYEEVNIKGTLNILECMKEKKIKNYVFASSSSVYGEKKESPFREDMVVDRPISFYAATKKAGEELNHVYHSLYNISTINLRFFTVYGPRQRPDLAIHKFAKMIDNKKAITIYGDGSFRRDFTYIEDIVDGIIKSIQKAESSENLFETYNLGESQTITVLEMVSLLEKAMNKKATKVFLEEQPGDVPLTYADISKAKKELNYNPSTKIKDGIPLFIEWFFKEKNRQ